MQLEWLAGMPDGSDRGACSAAYGGYSEADLRTETAFYAELLTGSMTAKQKREACGRIAPENHRSSSGRMRSFRKRSNIKIWHL